MAIVSVTKQSTGKPNAPTEYTMKSVSAGDTIKINASYKDTQTVVLFKGNGSNASTITIKAGNGYGGVNDLAFSLGVNKLMSMALDSARFVNVTGADKGNIVITASQACEVAVIELGLPAQSQPNA